MRKVRVDFINESVILSDRDVKRALPALQKQIRRDFAPKWGIDADLKFAEKKSPHPAAWWVVILDEPSQDYGYHQLTSQGLPIAKVFANVAKRNESPWTITASHELLEMLADPDANLYSQHSMGRGNLYFREICDPCEDDKFAYKIQGIHVSDFVYPSWYESFHKKGTTKFDHGGFVRTPFRKLRAGEVYSLSTRKLHAVKRASRRVRVRNVTRYEKRMMPRRLWRVSQPKH